MNSVCGQFLDSWHGLSRQACTADQRVGRRNQSAKRRKINKYLLLLSVVAAFHASMQSERSAFPVRNVFMKYFPQPETAISHQIWFLAKALSERGGLVFAAYGNKWVSADSALLGNKPS